MQVRAVTRYVRVQPRKVRIVADEVRGMPAAKVANTLFFHPSKGAFWLRKTLVSAIANAVENHGVAPETLKISAIQVDEGPRLKRIEQRAMGRGNRIVKKTSHITVVVEDAITSGKPKPHGTKEKPRPKFAAPKRASRKKDAVAAADTGTEEATSMQEVAENTAAPDAGPEPKEANEQTAVEESLAEAEGIAGIAGGTEGVSPSTAEIMLDEAEKPAEEGKE